MCVLTDAKWIVCHRTNQDWNSLPAQVRLPDHQGVQSWPRTTAANSQKLKRQLCFYLLILTVFTRKKGGWHFSPMLMNSTFCHEFWSTTKRRRRMCSLGIGAKNQYPNMLFFWLKQQIFYVLNFFGYWKFGIHGHFGIYWIPRNNRPWCIDPTV